MLSAKQYLIGLVYKETQTYLNEIDVVFSDPVKLAHGNSRNTHVKVFPKPWIAFANGFDLYYNRVHVSRIRPFKILKGSATTVHQVLDIINASQEFNFTTDDLVDSALPFPDNQGYVVFKPEFKETSLGFYSSAIVKTVTEYIDPNAPIPPDPIDPDDIPPAPYPPVSPGTTLRTECRGADLWYYRSRFQLPPEWVIGSSQHASCAGYTVTPVSARINTEEGDTEIITYFFNKPLSEPLNLRVRALDTSGNAAPIAAIQYKAANDTIWSLVNTAVGFTIPANTQFFSLMVATRLDTLENIFIRLVEKGGENKLANGGGIDVELNITGTNSTPPAAYEPYGTLVTEFCSSNSTWGRYNDGVGGTYEKVITLNDPNCGFMAKPTLTVDYGVATILEDAEHVFTYTLNEAVSSPLGLNVTINHISTVPADIAGLHYQLAGSSTWAAVPSNGNIAIPQGDLTFKLRLTTAEDILVEGNEYIQLKVSETAAARKLSTGPVLSNITVIDLAPPPLNPTSLISAVNKVINVDETGSAVVRFNISESVNYNAALLFKVIYQTAHANDIAQFEYQSGGLGPYTPVQHNETFYLVAGALYVDIRITPTADQITEGAEYLTISLEEPTPNVYFANTAPVVKRVNIQDTSTLPPQPKPLMTMVPGIIRVNEGNVATVETTFSIPSLTDIRVRLTINHITTSADDIDQIQYKSGQSSWRDTSSGSLIRLDGGDTALSIRIPVRTDILTELEEQFIVSLVEDVIGAQLQNTGAITKTVYVDNVLPSAAPPHETAVDPHWSSVTLFIPGVDAYGANGVIKDASIRRRIPTITPTGGTVTLEEDGITFSGGGGITMPSRTNLQIGVSGEHFTVEVDVFEVDSSLASSFPLSYRSSSNVAWEVERSGVGTHFTARDSSNVAAVQTNVGTVPSGQWTRLSWSFDGDYYREFVNGIKVRELIAPLYPQELQDGQLFIGHEGFGWYPFIGRMRNIRITKGVARFTADHTVDTSKLFYVGPLPPPVKPFLYDDSSASPAVVEGEVAIGTFLLTEEPAQDIPLTLTLMYSISDASDFGPIKYRSGDGPWIPTTDGGQVIVKPGDMRVQVSILPIIDDIPGEGREVIIFILDEPVVGQYLVNTQSASVGVEVYNTPRPSDWPNYQLGGDTNWNNVQLFIPGVGTRGLNITDISNSQRVITEYLTTDEAYLNGNGISFVYGGLTTDVSTSLILGQSGQRFSIEFDVLRTVDTTSTLMTFANGPTIADTAWSINVVDNQVSAYAVRNGVGSDVSFYGNMDRDVWNRVEFNFDGSSYRLFVNGVLLKTTTLANFSPANPSNARLIIGNDFSGNNGFMGKMRNIRITRGTTRHVANHTVDTTKLFPDFQS